MNGVIRILGIAGSLRQASFNRAALHAARELLPWDATLEIFVLNGIPPFSEDDEPTLPPRVVELKAKICEADAILIATPEYNYSIPGVLKNAIDWASRPTATTPGMASRSQSWGRRLARRGQRARSITCGRCS